MVRDRDRIACNFRIQTVFDPTARGPQETIATKARGLGGMPNWPTIAQSADLSCHVFTLGACPQTAPHGCFIKGHAPLHRSVYSVKLRLCQRTSHPVRPSGTATDRQKTEQRPSKNCFGLLVAKTGASSRPGSLAQWEVSGAGGPLDVATGSVCPPALGSF